MEILHKMDQLEIEVAEMKSLKSLVGYKLSDQERNTVKQNQHMPFR